MSKKYQLGYNTDTTYCSKCIKAGYFKMGAGNMLYHPDDGFVAPCVLEFEIEEVEDEYQNRTETDSDNM